MGYVIRLLWRVCVAFVVARMASNLHVPSPNVCLRALRRYRSDEVIGRHSIGRRRDRTDLSYRARPAPRTDGPLGCGTAIATEKDLVLLDLGSSDAYELSEEKKKK